MWSDGNKLKGASIVRNQSKIAPSQPSVCGRANAKRKRKRQEAQSRHDDREGDASGERGQFTLGSDKGTAR